MSALLAACDLAGINIFTSCRSSSPDNAPSRKAQIGLQIYSVDQELKEDFQGGLKRIYDMGYTEIELAGYRDGKIGGYTLVEYNKMAQDAGLIITGSHLTPTIRGPYTRNNMGDISEFWKQAVADHAEINVKTMVQPGMPSVETVDDTKLIGEVFNDAGRIAKDAGILWGYHNHTAEFNRILTTEERAEAALVETKRIEALRNGEINAGNIVFFRGPQGNYIEKLFIDNTDPDLVMFELDCYWTVMAQQDPCQWMKDYPDRFKLLHIKDKWIIGASGFMNWDNIFNTAYDIGILGWYVELESGGGDQTQFHGIEQSARFLLNAPFVK